jgi:hypothetical protein
VPDPVTVNVYNGTQTIGLGQTVKDALAQRGFATGEVKNDPLGRKIRGTGEIRYGEGADTTNIIDALRSWQPGMVVVKERTTKPHQVDFVLGAKFVALNDKAEPPPGTPKGACKPGTGGNANN